MTSHSSSSSYILILALQAWGVEGSAQGFLSVRESQSSLMQHLGLLTETLGQGHGVDQARLNQIERILRPIFTALPKNKLGRVSTPVMRYAVRRYFSSQHAWILKGFEPQAEEYLGNTSGVTDIMRGKLPEYVRTVLEKRFEHEGFSLEAVVIIVAAIERLTDDEVVSTVETAFELNMYEETQSMSESELDEILISFLLISMFDGSTDKQQHLDDKRNVHLRYPHWNNTKLFLKDVSGNDHFKRRNSLNPFVEQRNNFVDVARMAETITEQFGPWSNSECLQMKDILTGMDAQKTGRVKISEFYVQALNGQWQFLEPARYLSQIGALDETSEYLGPQLMIPNYITSISNCITSTTYYSICCLNECDLVFQHLEQSIRASSASTSQILEALKTLPNPPKITSWLHSRLEDASTINNGSIPLHGRLLAQWLHFAFPQECPYPNAVQAKDLVQRNSTVSEEEIKGFYDAAPARREPSPEAGMNMWKLEEFTLPASTPSDYDESYRAWFLRTFAQVGMLICGVILVLDMLHLRYEYHKGGKCI